DRHHRPSPSTVTGYDSWERPPTLRRRSGARGTESPIRMLVTEVAKAGSVLSDAVVRQALRRGLEGRFGAQRVLVLIPDHTRSVPLPLLFETVVEALDDA